MELAWSLVSCREDGLEKLIAPHRLVGDDQAAVHQNPLVRCRHGTPVGVRVVGVDWSGRGRGEERYRWPAEVRGGRPGRLEGLSRAGAADRMLELAARDADVIACLDFSFSMPAWF